MQEEIFKSSPVWEQILHEVFPAYPKLPASWIGEEWSNKSKLFALAYF